MAPNPSTSPGALTVQLFVMPDSKASRAAERFFKERRVTVHLVDLRKKPIAPGELKRFAERLGAAALLDTESRAYREKGLAYMRLDDAEIMERLLADPSLLRLPLARNGNAFTAGPAEATWKEWVGR